MNARQARELMEKAQAAQLVGQQANRDQETAKALAWVNDNIGNHVAAAKSFIQQAAEKGVSEIQHLHVCCQRPEQAESWELLVRRLSEELRKDGFNVAIKPFRYDSEDRLCDYMYISWA